VSRYLGRIQELMCAITLFSAWAAAATPFTPFSISHDGQDSRFAHTDGRFVVWTSIDHARNAELDVLGYDLVAGQSLVVSAGGNSQAGPDVSNGVAVWEDFIQGTGPFTIRGRNLGGGASFLVTNNPNSSAPAISGNRVVWHQPGSNGQYSIYGRRLDDPPGVAFAISDPEPYEQSFPDTDGHTVVWGLWDGVGNVKARDPNGGDVFTINSNSGLYPFPRVSGNNAVWMDRSGLYPRIFAKNLLTGVVAPLSSPEGYAEQPAIDGDLVVWRQNDAPALGGIRSDIYGRYLSGGEAFKITDTPDIDEGWPDVSGNLVIWEQPMLVSSNDIWGTYVPEPASIIIWMAVAGSMLARRTRRRQ
jgi:hypothetical protein